MAKEEMKQISFFLKNEENKSNNNAGFSLIEILVAVVLAAFLFSFVISSIMDTRRDMEKSLTDIERAIRYASDEASIRNVITRIQFCLDKTPQELTVEYGPDDSFVLPISDLELLTQSSLSLKEQEQYEKSLKDISKNFNPIPEFSDGPIQLSDNVRIIGVGTTLINHLISNFYATVYVYPTGEKDGAIIILASREEVISLGISPFGYEIERNYKIIEDVADEELETRQVELAKELYKEWLK